MANSDVFVWWGGNGTRHEGPIEYFQVPDGVKLRFRDRCGECDNEGRPIQHRERRDSDTHQASELSEKESDLGS